MRKQIKVVKRSFENTVALVSYGITEKFDGNLKSAVEYAVSKWQETDEGAKAVSETNWDFNIGDLVDTPFDMVFEKALEEKGVVSFSVEVISDLSNGNWEFDDVLCVENI